MRRKLRSPAARVLATAATVLVVGACATKSDIRDLQIQLRDELGALAARQDSLIQQLRVEAISTQDTLRTQSDQIFDFRGEITRQLRAISRGLTTLEALAGENQRGITGVRDQLANLRRVPVGPPPSVQDTAQTTGPSGEGVAGVEGTADQLWAVAREQHQRGSFSTAQRAYEQFLQEYANDELAPDAHFYLADILTQQDRPEDALEAFQEIQEPFPTAAKVPDALYRIAVIQIELGSPDDARATLERIMNTYPDASIALLARDKLEEIG